MSLSEESMDSKSMYESKTSTSEVDVSKRIDLSLEQTER